MTMQPDLFGEIEAAHCLRVADAFTCLAEAHPATLELLIGTRRPNRGEIKTGKSGDWAYRVCNDEFCFEGVSTWGGWHSKPAGAIAWAELDDLTAGDPRIDEMRAWSESLTAIEAGQDRTRPHELWPRPEAWHPSYIADDHERPGWPERLHVWGLAIELCRDIADRARAGEL